MKKNAVLSNLLIIGVLALSLFACGGENSQDPFYFIEKHRTDIGFTDFDAQKVTDTLGVESFRIILQECTLPVSQMEVYNEAGWKMAEDINDVLGDGDPKKVAIRFELAETQILHPEMGEADNMTLIIEADEL